MGAGVDVVLDLTADVPHVFQSFTGVLKESDQALDRAALFQVLWDASIQRVSLWSIADGGPEGTLMFAAEIG